MTRVKRGKTTGAKHKKIIKKTKGMSHIRRASIKKAKEAILKSQSYAYRDRKVKKRVQRRLWITRLNNAVRERGMTYSDFIALLKKNNVGLDRKILADIAVKTPEVFDKIVKQLG